MLGILRGMIQLYRVNREERYWNAYLAWRIRGGYNATSQQNELLNRCREIGRAGGSVNGDWNRQRR